VNLTEAHLQSRKALGADFKSAREALGLSIDDVSSAMKVSNSIVNAIESGLYDRLGAPVYARGFLRSYAKRIQFAVPNSSQMMDLGFEAEPQLIANSGERQTQENGERWMLSASYLVGTAILVSAAVLVMQADRLLPGPKAVVTTETQSINVAPDQSTSPSVIAAAPVTVVSTPPPQPAVEAIAAAMTAMPPLANNNSVSAPSEAAQGIVVQASATSWLRVSDVEGKEVFGNNLLAGRSRDFSEALPLDLTIGNAQGVQLMIDGKAVDLTNFTRGNVAKLRIASIDGVAQAQAR
jgi:cytoskeleton protein RodZ